MVTATGISSVATQLYTIREFLSQFQGNEFVIALILFNWLIIGGVGTMTARLLSHRFLKPSLSNLAWLSLALAVLPGLQIMAIRLLRDLVFIHGTSVGFYQTLSYTFLIIAPYCLLLGFVLPFSLYVLRSSTAGFSGARIYMADNLGDVSGGALFSFLLVYLLTPLQGVWLANIFLVISVVFLFDAPRPRIYWAMGGVAVMMALSVCVRFESASLGRPAGELVHYQETRYGRIEIHRDQEQYTLFADGSPLFSNQNKAAAQEAVHFPLSQLDSLESVLLISAEGGMLAEVAKHRPGQVDFVELDPALTKVEFEFGLLRRIDGLRVIHQDARSWLKSSDQLYDAIIVSLAEPATYQLNRFYTDSFFELARGHLSKNGILSFSVEGFDNYLDEAGRQKISSLHNTVAGHFEHVLMIPGQQIYFLLAQTPMDPDIPARLTQKGVKADYVTYYYHGNVTAERISYLQGLIDRSTPLNLDFSPYLMQIMFTQWFAKFNASPHWFIAGLIILMLIYLYRIKLEEFVLFSTGFITMGSEILVIFIFQIFCGYIYTKIGIIVTVFLAGLLPGAWLADRARGRDRQLLIGVEIFLLVVLSFFVTMLLMADHQLKDWMLLIFGFLVSLACGFQFPLALRMRGSDNRAAAQTFSADLLGAAGGTLLTSVALIPYLGIIRSVYFLIGLKVVSCLLVVGKK